jgi:hypothetical protein
MRQPFDIAARLAELSCDGRTAGQFEMRITADGDWHYQGSRIPRPELVKLFATALHRAPDGHYWLATPFEAGRVSVEDVPFTVVELSVEKAGLDQVIRLRTNLDDWVTLDAAHPLVMRQPPAGRHPAPYLVVQPPQPGRLALEARLLRPVFYELVELAEAAGPAGDELVVRSCARCFSLGRVAPT